MCVVVARRGKAAGPKKPAARAVLCLSLLIAAATACGDDPVRPDDACDTIALPLSGDADGPVITDVALEVQPGSGIVAIATATDPGGDDNLRDVLQSIGVFPDVRCEGQPIVIQDDLAGSGVEETFGTVVDGAANPSLCAAIAAATTWPVAVEFRDVDGNRTTGRVRARVSH